jgi:hypothetical protein
VVLEDSADDFEYDLLFIVIFTAMHGIEKVKWAGKVMQDSAGGPRGACGELYRRKNDDQGKSSALSINYLVMTVVQLAGAGVQPRRS